MGLCVLIKKYQTMPGYKKKSQITVLLILIMVVGIKTNFFKKLNKNLLNNYCLIFK